MRELLNVQTLTPGLFPVYPCLTFSTTSSWNLNMIIMVLIIILDILHYEISHLPPPYDRSEHIVLVRHAPDMSSVVMPGLGNTKDLLKSAFSSLTSCAVTATSIWLSASMFWNMAAPHNM